MGDKKANLDEIVAAFDQGSDLTSSYSSFMLISVTVGLLLVFGIFVGLKKANETDNQKDIFKIIGAFIFALISLLLFITISTD